MIAMPGSTSESSFRAQAKVAAIPEENAINKYSIKVRCGSPLRMKSILPTPNISAKIQEIAKIIKKDTIIKKPALRIAFISSIDNPSENKRIGVMTGVTSTPPITIALLFSNSPDEIMIEERMSSV